MSAKRFRQFPAIRFAIALILTASVTFCATNAQAGGHSWGWSKPMNKRMGAFYTSNKNANFQRHSTSRSIYNVQPRYVQSRHVQPHYIQPRHTGYGHQYVTPHHKVVTPQPTFSTRPMVIQHPTIQHVAPKIVKPIHPVTPGYWQ
ncbi:hypothetical protein [Rhodopirellula sp. MGV]|uniref:hypothetical protein n=1 Tax=Rhodopirellula sp. MGV TaxID=2023130 RepID=UPI000B967B6D|nr:hypothetical protein [Rhodopirellula sp. MGV]OYP36373.1 hypothetical protein CGZ80_08660 [Rhodopirellula sp. MGV]PNY38395.1 hypothetical protein C2E31_00120 [Rhodopirellula baltica]